MGGLINPFDVTGWQEVVGTIAVCGAVVACWYFTCKTTEYVATAICAALERIATGGK